jgi:uncharacterized membrane protein YuzA (DUF378 family)
MDMYTNPLQMEIVRRKEGLDYIQERVKHMAKTALTLVIIGALNWLLVGLFEWDLVAALFGGDSHRESSGFARIIYAIVGIAGLYCIRFYVEDNAAAR